MLYTECLVNFPIYSFRGINKHLPPQKTTLILTSKCTLYLTEAMWISSKLVLNFLHHRELHYIQFSFSRGTFKFGRSEEPWRSHMWWGWLAERKNTCIPMGSVVHLIPQSPHWLALAVSLQHYSSPCCNVKSNIGQSKN